MEIRFFKVTKEDAHIVLPYLGISNSNNGFHLSLNDNQSTCFFLFNCGFQCHATSGATVTCSISFAGIVEGVSPLWNPQKNMCNGCSSSGQRKYVHHSSRGSISIEIPWLYPRNSSQLHSKYVFSCTQMEHDN